MSPTTVARTNGERRADIETWLDDKVLTWEYTAAFPLASIDRDKSLNNQARISEPVNLALVEEYREAMVRGDVFPALIVIRSTPTSQAVNLDGNHRTEAALAAGQETFGAYVVKARPGTQQMTALTMEVNNHHGWPTSTEERVQHALWMIDNQRAPIERAATVMNVSANTVRGRWDKVKADRRADAVNLRRTDWDSLAATARTKLLTISTDEGFKAAARLAIVARLTVVEIDSLIAVVNESRSATKQVAAVKALRKDYADRISDVAAGLGGRGSASPRTRLRLALTNLLALPADFSTAITHSLRTPEERAEAAGQARAGAARLAELADSLEK